MRVDGCACARVEASLGCATIQLCDVRAQTALRVRACGIDLAQLDDGPREESFDGPHRAHELGALGIVERVENRGGQRVTALVELRSFDEPGPGEARNAHASVVADSAANDWMR